MIEQIQELKNFGIFEKFDGKQLQLFGKYNLFYGWNGSGKSTVSLLFESLEKKQIVFKSRFPESSFKIKCNDSIIIQDTNIQNNLLNIRTFNSNFVQENIDWNSHTKSILIIAKEKISEKANLDTLQTKQIKEREKLIEEEKDLKKKEDAQSKFLTDSAKRIKSSLQVIDTKDNRFLNYDKTKFENFITTNEVSVKNNSSILDEQALKNHIAASRPEIKPEITNSIKKIVETEFASIRERVIKLLEQSIVSKTIEHIASDPSLQTWIEKGLEIHKSKNWRNCEFCEGTISEERTKKLEEHFSSDFVDFKNKITVAIDWIRNQELLVTNLPLVENFYPELQEEYKTLKTDIESLTVTINELIKSWKELLELKKENPFQTQYEVNKISELDLKTFNLKHKDISDLIVKHNTKTKSFDSSVLESKQIIELHYATESVLQFEFYEKKQDITNQKAQITTLKNLINEREQEISALKASLVNVELGAKEFNSVLHSFLGRKDISLKFNESKFGYEICRNGSQRHSQDLSEGEKTAIAFVFFILKLKENNNQLKNTIVVIDDPISSFDSNSLFHAYAVLREHCKDAKQLFVFTHNFTFFRRICDWFIGTNNNRQNDDPPKPPNAFFYVIESSNLEKRSSKIVNAPDDLIKYSSEYHYLFCKLIEFQRSTNLNLESCYAISNLTRRILESFLSFKFPKNTKNFSDQLRKASKFSENITDEIVEKVQRFVDRYSHSNVFDIDSESLNSLVSECPNVINAVLKILEELDKSHFDEMLSLQKTKSIETNLETDDSLPVNISTEV